MVMNFALHGVVFQKIGLALLPPRARLSPDVICLTITGRDHA
jgi:hypothetical protein